MSNDLASELFEPLTSAPPPLFRANSSSSSSGSSGSSFCSRSSPASSSPPSSTVYSSSDSLSAAPSRTNLANQDPKRCLSDPTSPSQLVSTLDSLAAIDKSPSPTSPPPLLESLRRLPSRSRPRLPHHSLSSLSVYSSRPTTRTIHAPIPPSLRRSNLINNKDSPFHYQAVEGRGWEKSDGGGEERSGVKQTGRRSDWADDVLGIMETREGRLG